MVFDLSDRPLIPFPLCETNSYLIVQPDDAQLTPLLHQLNNIPTVTPEPLGPPRALPPKVSGEIDAALQAATTDAEAGAKTLEALCNSADPNTAAVAAFHLGEIRYSQRLLTKAIKAYQFALEFGPRTPVFEKAQQALLSAIALITAQHAEGNARAAVYQWLSFIKAGDILEAWKGLDRDVRLAMAQWWILGNADHPSLIGVDRDELAAALSAVQPNHPLAQPFLVTQLTRLQHGYAEVDPEHRGAAEKRRTYQMDYEIVILMATYGEETEWQAGMANPTSTFLMRRGLGKWLIAGFNGAIIHPGWPPTSEQIPLDEITFGTSEPPSGTGQ